MYPQCMHILSSYVGKKVTLDQLTLIKYKKETGKIHRLCVIDEACLKWKDIGILYSVLVMLYWQS